MPRDRKAGSQSEANIMRECMMALSQAGCVIWRNNTGVLPDRNGKPIRFGLCVGSADLIGIAPDGRFLAVETKTALGQPTEAQVRFLAAVRKAGGRAGIARSAADAVRIATGDGHTG